MQSEKSSMAGGVWLLIGIVALLAVPMVIGHYVLPAAAESASITAAN